MAAGNVDRRGDRAFLSLQGIPQSLGIAFLRDLLGDLPDDGMLRVHDEESLEWLENHLEQVETSPPMSMVQRSQDEDDYYLIIRKYRP